LNKLDNFSFPPDARSSPWDTLNRKPRRDDD
jgi:hypothetical protein